MRVLFDFYASLCGNFTTFKAKGGLFTLYWKSGESVGGISDLFRKHTSVISLEERDHALHEP